jgi:putative NIF3 family GTP cyclohydrolase 1 type 2
MRARNECTDSQSSFSRRKFIYDVSAMGAGLVLAAPVASRAANLLRPLEQYTVQQVMDLFIKDVPGGVLKNTVDTLKAGSSDTIIKSIVTTMFATVAVIRRTIDLGANFIIAHEPTFYNHPDETDWLKDDKVYQFKRALLDKHGIAVWRNHDYIHHLVPDGVTVGVLDKLGWRQYSDKDTINILTMPPTPLKELISHAKSKLIIDKVRYVGDPEQKCSRILFMPGAAGGRMQIQSIEKVKPDVLICGEIQEWETAEYVRDAVAKGDNISLVVLGHIASEEAGSEFMLNWLKEKLPGIKATHVPTANSLSFM